MLDATVIRALLVPAVVSLFGRWNWWLPRTHALRPCCLAGRMFRQTTRSLPLPGLGYSGVVYAPAIPPSTTNAVAFT